MQTPLLQVKWTPDFIVNSVKSLRTSDIVELNNPTSQTWNQTHLWKFTSWDIQDVVSSGLLWLKPNNCCSLGIYIVRHQVTRGRASTVWKLHSRKDSQHFTFSTFPQNFTDNATPHVTFLWLLVFKDVYYFFYFNMRQLKCGKNKLGILSGCRVSSRNCPFIHQT